MPNKSGNPPPVGPLTEKQRRLEQARRAVVDLTAPSDRFFDAFCGAWPSTITPDEFREMQFHAADLREQWHRAAQSLFDLIAYLGDETVPAELLEIERAKDLRIKARVAKSDAKWNAEKQRRAAEAKR